jgi:hypothetical protein
MRRLIVLWSAALAAVVVLISGATFIGGTKIRPLFGLSAEALAGSEAPPIPLRSAIPAAGAMTPEAHATTPDASATTPDAGAAPSAAP